MSDDLLVAELDSALMEIYQSGEWRGDIRELLRQCRVVLAAKDANKDAERYRYFRRKMCSTMIPSIVRGRNNEDQLDDAIDAAMAKEPPEEPLEPPRVISWTFSRTEPDAPLWWEWKDQYGHSHGGIPPGYIVVSDGDYPRLQALPGPPK